MAETVESSKENPDSSVARFDRDFDVNADTTSHDMDDEATLEEEETLEAAEGFNEEELDDLQKEAEVPLEDLLAYYYNPGNQRQEDEEQSENVDVPLDEIQPEPLPLYEQTEDLTQNGLDLSPGPSPLPQDSPESQTASPSQSSSIIPPENQRITRGLAAAYQYFPDSDSSSSDEDYCPTEDWKKEIQIGPEHQAVVPETTCPDSNQFDERSSKCLWSPKGISDVELQKYMNSVCAPSIWDEEMSAAMEKGDDEQALYVLLQCNYNCEEAIKKFKAQPPPEEMTFWSEEECRNFELGLRTSGKDFYSIQQAKIPNRTVGDIVQFYYLWKKTERHDAFSWQMRPNKKKYSFHPGITEYMDRFLDENESAASSRASSPHNSVVRPQTTPSSFGAEVVNHVAPNRPPVLAATPLANPAASSGILRIPQAYVPTPVIVTNDKEPPAKKPNLGNGDSNILSNGPPPLKSVTATTDHQIPRLHVTSHVMNVPSQLVTGMNPSESISSMGSNSLSYSSLNTRPTHHSHLNIHNIESGSSYTRLTQNS